MYPYIVIVLGNKHWREIYKENNWNLIRERFITINLAKHSEPYVPITDEYLNEMINEYEEEENMIEFNG